MTSRHCSAAASDDMQRTLTYAKDKMPIQRYTMDHDSIFKDMPFIKVEEDLKCAILISMSSGEDVSGLNSD